MSVVDCSTSETRLILDLELSLAQETNIYPPLFCGSWKSKPVPCIVMDTFPSTLEYFSAKHSSCILVSSPRHERHCTFSGMHPVQGRWAEDWDEDG